MNARSPSSEERTPPLGRSRRSSSSRSRSSRNRSKSKPEASTATKTTAAATPAIMPIRASHIATVAWLSPQLDSPRAIRSRARRDSAHPAAEHGSVTMNSVPSEVTSSASPVIESTSAQTAGVLPATFAGAGRTACGAGGGGVGAGPSKRGRGPAPGATGGSQPEEGMRSSPTLSFSQRLPGVELGVDPVHHRAQLLALALDLVVRALFAHALEVLLAGAVLGDPLACERSGLDLAEHVPHRLARRLGDDPPAAREVAVLGGVGDRVAHPGDALLVHEVDDQLELVQALEVRQPGVVARVDERLVPGADELGDAAAQHGLLAEQVSLGLVLERRFDHAAARAADALGVGERELLGVAGLVLVDRDQAR